VSEANSLGILRAIWAVSTRQTIPSEALREIVGRGVKQVGAYNMCDGEKTQAEIRKALNLDKSNFRRTVSRWVDEGIVARLEDGKLLHVYPVAKAVESKKDNK
jgi:DNA-binding MarR family transcriptional regulator